MTRASKLGLVFFTLLAVMVIMTVATGGCNQAAPVECPTSVVIDGHVFQSVNGTLVTDKPIDGCPYTYSRAMSASALPKDTTVTKSAPAKHRKSMLENNCPLEAADGYHCNGSNQLPN